MKTSRTKKEVRHTAKNANFHIKNIYKISYNGINYNYTIIPTIMVLIIIIL